MKKRYAWGCRVTFNDGTESWAWETCVKTRSCCPYAFTDSRKGIMPLVELWRGLPDISKAIPVKVCLDDLLED